MEKKTFNPAYWLDSKKHKTGGANNSVNNGSKFDEVERIIQKIEANQIDITSTHKSWTDIGFAFAEGFSDSGRDFFHRVSKYYPAYSRVECDKQYDNCLKSNGKGITLSTFFFYYWNSVAKISKAETIDDLADETLQSFPDSIVDQLPLFLQKVIKFSSSTMERDILLIGTLGAISACLHKFYGIYGSQKVSPNIYVFITANASAGKGKLVYCKKLVKPIHQSIREKGKMLQQMYDQQMMDYREKKSKNFSEEKPVKPPTKMLFIPANNSSTGAFQLLYDNDGRGLMFETEGDTLSQTFKTEYGNYSDGFRKAFHHESISYYRRTDSELAEIDRPCLSGVFSGTPKQVLSLIPDAENGLFSRFVFYFMQINPIWNDVFENNSGNGLDDHFEGLANEFFKLYQTLETNREIQFCFSEEQQFRFNLFFSKMHDTYFRSKGIKYVATVRRLGLIAFRMAMILSALRILESGDLPEKIECEEKDFQTVLEISKVLVKHASKVFSEFQKETPLEHKKLKERFHEALPETFNKQYYAQVAASLSIEEKTAEGYITEFIKNEMIFRPKKDHYINPKCKGAKGI